MPITIEIPREQGAEREEALDAITVSNVAADLSDFLRTNPGPIPLRHKTLGVEAAMDLLNALSSSQVKAKIESFGKVHRHPHVAALIADLVDIFGAAEKLTGEDDVLALVAYLRATVAEKRVTVVEELPERVLTFDELDEVILLANLEDKGSTAFVLTKDPLCALATGVPIHPARLKVDKEERGFALPEKLLEIYEALRHAKSSEVLKDWTLGKLVDGKEYEVILLFGLLADFAYAVADEDFVQLYAKGKEVLPLLPFQALQTAVAETIKDLDRGSGAQTVVQTLRDIEQRINFRFYGIAHILKDHVSVSVSQRLAPGPVELAVKIVDWVGQCNERHESVLSDSVLAGNAVKVLRHFETDGAAAFWEEISQSENIPMSLKEALRYQLMEYGLLPDPDLETLQMAIRILKRYPAVDLGKRNFNKLFPPGLTEIHVFNIPGTYGPFHLGHRYLIDRVVAYIHFLNELYRDGDRIKRVALITPNPNIAETPGSVKKFADAGTIRERVAAIILSTAGIEDLYITTALQPDPAATDSLWSSMVETKNRFIAKLNNDLGRAGRPSGIEVKFVYCGGDDELNYERDDSVVSAHQPRKFHLDSLLHLRTERGIIRCLENAREISEYTKADVILAPPARFPGSSRTAKKIRGGDLGDIVASARPFVAEHWSATARSRREQAKFQRQPIPSVNEIFSDLMREMKGLSLY